MIMTKDNDFSCKENVNIDFASMSVIGDRKTQDDCFGYEMNDDSLLACVCDGMGGYSGGREASKIAVRTILQAYCELGALCEAPYSLIEMAKKANAAVWRLRNYSENTLNAGSTLVMAYIKDNMLHWTSVGDSRLYIRRKNEFIQMTKDQNYDTVLKEKVNAGEITDEEYLRRSTRKDALVNYLGIENLNLIDYNTEPLKLKSGDQLIVCSDGLYKVLSDVEISELLNINLDAKTTLQMIEIAVRKKAKDTMVRRDNMTVSLIKIK